ncbi:MAG TPA: hypothetical protein VK786_04815 [bacterium]|jgi:hypothetical protein|nr:hypothetical protein [bacterium]
MTTFKKMSAALLLTVTLLPAAGRLSAASAPVLIESGCIFGGNNNINNSADLSVPDGVSNGLLLIRIQADTGSVPPASVSYDGVSLSPLAPTKTSDSGYLQTWYLLKPSEGETHPLVVVSKDGFQGHSWNVVEEFYGGVDLDHPFGAKAHGVIRESAAWSVRIKTRYDHSMVDDFLEVFSDPASFVPGGRQVLDADAPWCGGGASANRGDRLSASKAGTQILTYTLDTPKSGAYQVLEIRAANAPPPVFSVSAEPVLKECPADSESL